MIPQHIVTFLLNVKITDFLITQGTIVDTNIIQKPAVGGIVVQMRGLVSEHQRGSRHGRPENRASLPSELPIEKDLRPI